MQRLNENLGKLTAKFEKATSDKLKCQQEAEATACIFRLAQRSKNNLYQELDWMTFRGPLQLKQFNDSVILEG